MPLTQEKRLDKDFSNNNDQSYLHKKFKKMASSISAYPANTSKGVETRYKETNISQAACNSAIANSSIAASHPEIEKIKERSNKEVYQENNVQININNENSSLRDVNNFVQVSGQTSLTDEFSNKTENLENEFIKESYNGGSGGRYTCPYCKLSCAKPSVLQKHIRAHTNERPYPCVPCGFAFKTKSNLYKHRRSRTHALRLQGADISVINEEDLSGGSDSDTSIAPTSISDASSEPVIRFETSRPNEFSSPELASDDFIANYNMSLIENNRSKSIYKPKFRAALYHETDEKDKIKKSISQNANFLTEHISKIISDNKAIVDVIDTPLQKKYNKIKQIAESKQYQEENIEVKHDNSPLNLTKTNFEPDNSFRKRSHSESFSNMDHQKHPLNPEGSIIKDLLLKTKGNGLTPLTGELVDGLGPLFICPLCQIIYRSAENLEVHRLYYCKGSVAHNTTAINMVQREVKTLRPDNIFVRSNSINVRLPEAPINSFTKSKSPPLRNKPENLVIIKPESSDIVAPLPSPGPLLGNTRLVDTRLPSEFSKQTENIKIKPFASPKRRLDSSSDNYSPRSVDNISPKSSDLYSQPKIRCIETSSLNLRTFAEMQQLRNNSTSLQMFGGEVKIIDHLGSTTTLRIEPSKNQLSPILIQQNLSPSKLTNDAEASSVVVRSGLHSGGTIMHNPPMPKEKIVASQARTPRISISTAPSVHSVSDITHFQFPPLSAITAFNPLTLPPLSPSSSPSGASTILHGGKLIPHVPGIPGPNTPAAFAGDFKLQSKQLINKDTSKPLQLTTDSFALNGVQILVASSTSKYDSSRKARTPTRISNTEKGGHGQNQDICRNEVSHYNSTNVPIIKVRNVDESNGITQTTKNLRSASCKHNGGLKRSSESVSRTPILKENVSYNLSKNKREKIKSPSSQTAEDEIRNFNFENLITKAEIYSNQIASSSEVQKNLNSQESTSPVSLQNERSETAYFQKSVPTKPETEDRKPKFLRPSTLPLKPGTFTPKRHHGITPNANTMPLVSPETPRPAKAYGQLYLNGNAYTYLGLKCSTKVFYCTINRPQPTYVPNQHFLSMYSNWQLLSELTPDPLGLTASSAMSLYDSRHRPQNVALAVVKQDLILTHSSQWNKNSNYNKQTTSSIESKISDDDNKIQVSDNNAMPKKELAGGFESNEEYTYVRGRGRGRYVCSECGIRCKKPSMLKKHIRTHTDVRPYTCIHCAFSFKTKGNLTKHMKSKAHYKKCCELGINPNEGNDADGETPQFGDSDDDSDSEGDEGNEGETESSDTEACKSRLPEHEAAHCLLSLGCSRPTTSDTPGLITSARPSTYPYSPTAFDSTALDGIEERPQISRRISVDSENEPMDLSKNEVKTSSMPEIPTARESSVLASLASNTAKLPLYQTQWSNGEPMLHTYLTERALFDSKIKQSQLASNLSKLKKVDLEKCMFTDNNTVDNFKSISLTITTSCSNVIVSTTISTHKDENERFVNPLSIHNDETVHAAKDNLPSLLDSKNIHTIPTKNAENAKHVVSEYLKHARINLIKAQDENCYSQTEDINDDSHHIQVNVEDTNDEQDDTESIKLPDHDPIARKVVIGVGGVAFKVSKGKEFESASYAPGRLMEDGRRVCDFCNKTFTKPSQLKLHLNIHYMERPFRCSVCAVSFRTRGHLQKHERSGSHHNKVSMTSTFGAATSFNPRPFRCSDCNIAFRIHGHLAKHLRSKMHVMRLECLFKLPFGTFTEIERAGVSLTDIDTTDCASSLASLQSLARKLHEKDPTKLEYRESNGTSATSGGRESPEDEEVAVPPDKVCDHEKDIEMKIKDACDGHERKIQVDFSATDN